jgi:hypothetical protein
MLDTLTETRGYVEEVTKPDEEALKSWLLTFESMHKEIGHVEREKHGYGNREQPGYCSDNSHAV